MRNVAHRRQNCCAIIEDLAFSGFNVHLAAFRSWVECWDYGGESGAVLLCCAALLLPLVLLVYASTEVTKNVVLLPESAPEYCEQIIKHSSMYLVKKCPRAYFRESLISRWSLRLK